jgi:hypothetical protein
MNRRHSLERRKKFSKRRRSQPRRKSSRPLRGAGRGKRERAEDDKGPSQPSRKEITTERSIMKAKRSDRKGFLPRDPYQIDPRKRPADSQEHMILPGKVGKKSEEKRYVEALFEEEMPVDYMPTLTTTDDDEEILEKMRAMFLG